MRGWTEQRPVRIPPQCATLEEVPMSVAKIIEISCESPKSFEDAIQSGIARASKTVHNIKGAWVKEQQVIIENNKISMYRVDLKVTFVLE
jgi:dodecin